MHSIFGEPNIKKMSELQYMCTTALGQFNNSEGSNSETRSHPEEKIRYAFDINGLIMKSRY